MNPVFKSLSGAMTRGVGMDMRQFGASQLSQKPYADTHPTPEEQLMQVQQPNTKPYVEDEVVLEEGCHDSDLRTCIPEAKTESPPVSPRPKPVQKSFLSGPMTMKKAIILTEILDKPLALRRKR